MGRTRMFVGLFRGLQNPAVRRERDESAFEGLSIVLHGRETYPFEVVGSARRQSEIQAVAGRGACVVRRQRCIATLSVAQDGSSGGVNVGVFVEGAMVGCFPRYLTTQYREWLQVWNLSRAKVHCHALILRDGNNIEARAGEYRVKLDIEIPFKMTTFHF